jgi:hypothetical protein
MKHVENFIEINKLCNVASCWLHLEIYLRCTDPWTSKQYRALNFGQQISEIKWRRDERLLQLLTVAHMQSAELTY